MLEAVVVATVVAAWVVAVVTWVVECKEAEVTIIRTKGHRQHSNQGEASNQ